MLPLQRTDSKQQRNDGHTRACKSPVFSPCSASPLAPRNPDKENYSAFSISHMLGLILSLKSQSCSWPDTSAPQADRSNTSALQQSWVLQCCSFLLPFEKVLLYIHCKLECYSLLHRASRTTVTFIIKMSLPESTENCWKCQVFQN